MLWIRFWRSLERKHCGQGDKYQRRAVETRDWWLVGGGGIRIRKSSRKMTESRWVQNKATRPLDASLLPHESLLAKLHDFKFLEFGFGNHAIVPAASLVVLFEHLRQLTDLPFGTRLRGCFLQEAFR